MIGGPILLIGPVGQVGWELRRTLAPLGRVVTAGRNGADEPLDLADPDSIELLIARLRPRLVVNAAAYTAVDRAEEESALAEAVNAIAPGRLAEAAKRHAAGLIHYSTDYVFDGTASTPYREGDAPHPQSVYGRTKLVGEAAVAAAGGDYLILRTSWVYGLRGANFLLTMRRLAREREQLRVVDDQIGAPTWSRLIAETTALLIPQLFDREGGWRGERSGIYHLSCSGATSWHGFAEAILDYERQQGGAVAALEAIPTRDYPTAAARPAYSVLDNTKLLDRFGLRLPDWREALALCLADH